MITKEDLTYCTLRGLDVRAYIKFEIDKQLEEEGFRRLKSNRFSKLGRREFDKRFRECLSELGLPSPELYERRYRDLVPMD